MVKVMCSGDSLEQDFDYFIEFINFCIFTKLFISITYKEKCYKSAKKSTASIYGLLSIYFLITFLYFFFHIIFRYYFMYLESLLLYTVDSV